MTSLLVVPENTGGQGGESGQCMHIAANDSGKRIRNTITSVNPSLPASRQIYLLLVLWLTSVVCIGYFDLGNAVPPVFRGVIVVAGILLPTLISRIYAPFRALLDRMPDATIVAFHGWRILAGFVFLSAGDQGLLPPVFVHNAGYGDIAVGFLAPLILALPENRKRYIGFHLFGLTDFVVAVGTGLYFTLAHNPLQNNLFSFPLVVIPWYGVGLSGASHLIALHRLLFGSTPQAKSP